MPDFRYDPVSARWVAIASNRLSRPMEFVALGEKLSPHVRCPFCGGREDETPRQLEVWNAEGERAETTDTDFKWSTRVVPNKFPSFPSDVPQDPYDTTVLGDLDGDFGPYRQSRRPGGQELIIPTPRHVSSFSELTEQEAKICLAACQARMSALANRRNIAHGMLFMNCRSAAGASLAHVHLQLIGSPIVTQAMTDRIDRNRRYQEENGKSLMQAIIDWECAEQIRVVLETEHFCVICPYASRAAYQVWIVPKDLTRDFMSMECHVREDLALLCQTLIARLDQSLQNPAYNLLLQMDPFRSEGRSHWYVEIMPRLTRAAGLEWGTDIWINPVSPEDAAKVLRG